MIASSNGADVSYLDGHLDTLLHNFENGGECKTGERRRADQVNGIWLISYIQNITSIESSYEATKSSLS